MLLTEDCWRAEGGGRPRVCEVEPYEEADGDEKLTDVGDGRDRVGGDGS
jgi:hypothetical protein